MASAVIAVSFQDQITLRVAKSDFHVSCRIVENRASHGGR
jgi:hypothetical protein